MRAKKNIKVPKKRTYRKKNIDGNFRGVEDRFWKKVKDGFIKFLESPFK